GARRAAGGLPRCAGESGRGGARSCAGAERDDERRTRNRSAGAAPARLRREAGDARRRGGAGRTDRAVTAPEFSREVDERQISPKPISIEANAEEPKALARRCGIVAIHQHQATVTLERDGE